MIVCISGMHRSGTSMIARMLNICGVYLGEEKHLIPAAQDNPEGFWEHSGIRSINESILLSFGGNWDFPPTLHRGWETSSHLEVLNERLSEVLLQFDGCQVWGWKDPQNSITLPYWKAKLPGFKVLVCVRNPFDVYQSLAKRGYSSNQFAYSLWLKYYSDLLAEAPADSVITHFESYFHDAGAELRRVTSLLGLEVNERMIQEAASTLKSGLRHSHGNISDLKETGASIELIEKYQKLCQKSGPVFMQAIEHAGQPTEEYMETPTETPEEARRIIAILRNEHKQDVRNFSAEIDRLKHQLKETREELDNIYNSRGWALLTRLRKIVSIIKPGSAL